MLRHIVLLTLKDGLTEDDRAAYLAAVRAMCEASDEVQSYTLGINRGSGPNHHDVALVADFDDWEAFRRYIDSPAHSAYVENHAKRAVERLAAIQHDI